MFIQSGLKYKSLEPFNSPVELPDFVVLSGLNGSGKSQLLVAINEKLISLTDNEESDGNQRLEPVKFVDHNTLTPNDSVIVAYDTLRQPIENSVLQYITHRDRHVQNPDYSLRNSILQNPGLLKLAEIIAERSGKDIDNLDINDFYAHYPLRDDFGHRDIFHQNFSILFKRYHLRRLDNDVDQFRSQKYGDVKFHSDDDFLKEYGEPPWLLVNKIIAEADLGYHVCFPEDLHRDAPYEFKLVNDLNGAEINFSDLSGGEKVVMSLALSLYNSNFDIEFPKVLLMDEPDSHLHPSMTKKFLDVIQNVFVDQKKVKVIISTHSPSTVALAPDESLFLMRKTEPRITKTTKDKALRVLTAGVPTLSIDYENRRQVFVESKYDVMCYEKIYEKLKNKLVSEISINFISSGVGGQGNCDQVEEVVNKLTSYGNRTIYGIIDWDKKNKGSSAVKVLGKDKRYSLENYIFDPLLLTALLVREKFIDVSELGMSDGERYTDFSNFDSKKLQSMANFVVGQVRPKVENPDDSVIQEVEYVGGKQITLPTWFLTIQGHDLERYIKEVFPKLNKFHREGDLKKEITDKVIDDMPDFIPKDLFDILSEIQDYVN